MSTRPSRPYTQAIRDIIGRSPATLEEIVNQVWALYPAAPCIASYRRTVDKLRAQRGSPKVGYRLTLDEQHRAGAKRMIARSLANLVENRVAVREGGRYRLL